LKVIGASFLTAPLLAGVSFPPVTPDRVAGLRQPFLVAAKLLQGFGREELRGIAGGMSEWLEVWPAARKGRKTGGLKILGWRDEIP
jgi:hypothetical protein